MKRPIFILFALLLMSTICLAQAPQGISYQAIFRDASGAPLVNANVSVRLIILQGSVTGPILYQEQHKAASNSFGLVNLVIGSGAIEQGDFTLVDWANGPYYLNVLIDPLGGVSFTDMATTELLSVPYALYAGVAESVLNTDDADADSTNEIQSLSLSNDTLSLSSGGSIILPIMSGPTGPTGADGAAGVDGTDGVDGIDGTTGPTGPTGADGAAGATGADGTDGVDGVDGVTGATGPTGADGAVGADGTDGVDGVDGVTGATGPTGADGAAGADGTDGVDGVDGVTGATGPTGADGAAGTDGTDGVDGIDGAAGTDGTDGVDGIDGVTGPTGPTGADGTDGVDGVTGPTGSAVVFAGDGIDIVNDTIINTHDELWNLNSGDIVALNRDVVVHGGLGVGSGILPGQAFGSTTIYMEENNIRVIFEDNSNLSGFPDNDWQITINDPSSGGAEYFAVKDRSAGETPFKIMAGADEGQLIVDTAGVGIATDDPNSTFEVNGTFATSVRTGLESGTDDPDNTATVWIYSSNAGAITLPAASSCRNRRYTILNNSGSAITISSYISFGGGASTNLNNGVARELISDGTNWYRIR